MNNDTIFKASINVSTLMEKEILPLKVDLKLGLSFDDIDPYHQAIALERARILINVIFNNSIFASRNNELCHKLKEMTSTPIVECWDEPWDQFIALLVYYKLSAVMENKGFIDFINITGDTISDDLEYTYYADTLNTNPTDDDLVWIKKTGLNSLWYHRGDTSVNEDNNEKELSWEMLGLSWDPKKKKLTEDHVNNIKQFTPKIIK